MYVYMNVHSSITPNGQKVATTLTVHQLMNEQNVVCLNNGIFFSHKMNEVLMRATTWVNFENVMLSERRQTQKATYYKILYI